MPFLPPAWWPLMLLVPGWSLACFEAVLLLLVLSAQALRTVPCQTALAPSVGPDSVGTRVNGWAELSCFDFLALVQVFPPGCSLLPHANKFQKRTSSHLLFSKSLWWICSIPIPGTPPVLGVQSWAETGRHCLLGSSWSRCSRAFKLH